MSSISHCPRRGQSSLRKGRHSLGNGVYHVTTTTHGRQRLFEGFGAARAVVRSLNAPQLLGDTALIAWVLMPDHLHILLQLGECDGLSAYVERFKSASARSVNRRLGRIGPVWQRAFHDHQLRNDEDVRVVARYVVMNPLRAGLVKRIAEYPHWDAIWVLAESGRA
jgi:putative transposase